MKTVILPISKNSTTPGLLERLGFKKLSPISGFSVWSDGKLNLILDNTGQYKAGICISKPGNTTDFVDAAGVHLYRNFPTVSSSAIHSGACLGGNFYEVSIAVSIEDYKPTIQAWVKEGWNISNNDPDKHNYVTLAQETGFIGIYQRQACPHRFNSPALTYFQQDMAERIIEMEKSGIIFAEKIKNGKGIIDSAILETEEGHHFFFFGY